MAFRHNHEKRLVIQGNRFNACFGIRFRHHHRVQFAAFEQIGQHGGIVFFQEQRHFGRDMAHRHNQPGQKIRRNRENQTQPERTFQLVLLRIGKVADDFRLFQNALRLRHDGRT